MYGYRFEKMWVQIRDVVGTDQRVGTYRGPGICALHMNKVFS